MKYEATAPIFILFYEGDSLSYHDGHAFTTKDRDNDLNKGGNCAVLRHGAWWYNNCQHSNLNGRYFNESGRTDASGINWRNWKNNRYSMKRALMKIRPNK